MIFQLQDEYEGGSIRLHKTGNYYSEQNTARLIDEAFEDVEVLINHVG